MEIGPVRNNQPKPPSNDAERPQQTETQAASSTPHDRVEISDNARQKLAELADRARTEEVRATAHEDTTTAEGGDRARPVPSELSQQDRLAEVRRRIEAGFYERDDILSDIADKLSDDLAP